MKMKMFSQLFIGIFLIIIANVKSDSVCDLNTFIVEVKQDLADNGMLDCLRVIDPPHFVEESEDQKNLRLAAQWDTSCAFESTSNWMDKLKRNYKVSNLVDSIGEKVENDFEEQADLCEILRAAVAKNLFDIPDLNMQKLPMDIVDKIDCAGSAGNVRSGPRICAASGGSYFQKDSWSIFLDTSTMRVGGKPVFVPAEDEKEKPTNPYANNANPVMQNTLIKDLMKFTKDQLDMKQGELVNMIDKAQAREKKKEGIEPEKDKEDDKSKQAHVHVKRLKDISFQPNDNKFIIADGAQNEFEVDKSRIIFGFYMASLKADKPGNGFFKLSYANREMPETRQAVHITKQTTVTGAFGEVYNPPKDNPKIEMKVLYDVTSPAQVKTDSGEQNFSFGAVTFPKGSVFKHVNTANMEINKSDKWNPLANFSLNINYQEKKETYFFIMYNLAFKLPSAGTLQTRLKFGKGPVPETATTNGPTTMIGNHAGMVMRVKPGSTQVGVEYKYNGPQVVIDDFTDNHFGQSISAFELPSSAEVKNFKLSNPATLNTQGEWKSFEMEASFELKKKRTVLMLYHINLKVDKANFAARIRMDTRYNKKSVYSCDGQGYAYAQGYVVKVMKAGTYTVDIDYKSKAATSFDPSTAELDGQGVSLQIILLD